MEQIVIIGTGCAGLTAAIYAARSNLSPLVLTGTMPGGLLTTTSTVENYPGFPEGVDGYELMVRMQKQAERFGARVQVLRVVEAADLSKNPFVLTVDGEKVETKTVIIATGASHRHLGLESEHLLEKKGVTYCATCDGAWPMFRNQPLVVVGGGDSACEEALYLTRFASRIHLIHRRDTLRASKIMAGRVLAHPKIKPVWDSAVTEILDPKQDKVTAVRLKNLKTGGETNCLARGYLSPSAMFRTPSFSRECWIWMKTVTSSPGAARPPTLRGSLWRAIAPIMSIARPLPPPAPAAPPPLTPSVTWQTLKCQMKNSKSKMKPRRAAVRRATTETRIALSLQLDGAGKSRVSTGIPFFDHMLTLFAKHATMDLVCLPGRSGGGRSSHGGRLRTGAGAGLSPGPGRQRGHSPLRHRFRPAQSLLRRGLCAHGRMPGPVRH